MKNKFAAALLLSLLLAGVAGAETKPQNELSADEIIARANHMSLYQGADSKGRVSMVITDKKGYKRLREFNMLRKDDGDADLGQKYFVFFSKPADVRKMIFMVHKHVKPGKDDDRWLYMPSLDLVKRIAASDKRTSFVGSDFLYEDISGRTPADDVHELIETTDEFYIIKNTPKDPDSVEFEYYVAYLHKRHFLPMKIKFFKKHQRLYRVIENDRIEELESEVDDQKVVYPTVTRSIARDMESGGVTQMTFSDIKYNIGLKDNIFTERYLRRPPREALR